MTKAQYSVVYLLAVSGILIFLLGMIFLMSNSFQKATTDKLGNIILDSINSKIETGLLELKSLSKNSQNATVILGIPELIGEQRYSVMASGNAFELRTFGNPSLANHYNLTFWNATLRGTVFSSKGKIRLEFLAANNTVTFK